MTTKQSIGIIGGGIMGISLGYFLSKQGMDVTIYEASPVLGGLAGPITLEDGTEVDRFYHAILSSDHHLSDSAKSWVSTINCATRKPRRVSITRANSIR
ncbi:MAG: FAD-dependent oxidoreductase [Anaerolineales bacterium]